MGFNEIARGFGSLLSAEAVSENRRFIFNEPFAAELFRRARWSGKTLCPDCGVGEPWRIGNDYQCRSCTRHFSDTSGTVFNKTRLLSSQRLAAVALLGKSAFRSHVSARIGVDYRRGRRVAVSFVSDQTSVDSLVIRLLNNINLCGRSVLSRPGTTFLLGMEQYHDHRLLAFVGYTVDGYGYDDEKAYLRNQIRDLQYTWDFGYQLSSPHMRFLFY